eukprot:TRINITY_DN5825_c0_g1_i1.p3 TRINITY_DN5825_c0_g1~~TRINITY_DN5825_c0_g1_i1.p3  ORF type:complete len:140 (+),score=2.41 TRINITY_DN5825_c0_g1_i1:36-455(+)
MACAFSLGDGVANVGNKHDMERYFTERGYLVAGFANKCAPSGAGAARPTEDAARAMAVALYTRRQLARRKRTSEGDTGRREQADRPPARCVRSVDTLSSAAEATVGVAAAPPPAADTPRGDKKGSGRSAYGTYCSFTWM